LALLSIVAVLGCLSFQKEAPTTTTTSEPTATAPTSTTESTTASTTTTTTTAAVSAKAATLANGTGCERLGSGFWGALCFDDMAYATSDPSLCHTVYCKARFEGKTVCEGINLNSTDWKSYKLKACEAWAQKTPSICREQLKSGDCIRWYGILANNYTLCVGGQTDVKDNCAWEFAQWRGNLSVCDKYKTRGNRLDCEANYYMMQAMENNDQSYCAGIGIPKTAQECKQAANWTGRPEKHPLYGLLQQIIEVHL
jgi:hypothetical protein